MTIHDAQKHGPTNQTGTAPCGECVDWENRWGRVTKLLEIPWDSSGGKVCEEIRKLLAMRNDCGKLAASAALDCGGSTDQLVERLAEIQRVTER